VGLSYYFDLETSDEGIGQDTAKVRLLLSQEGIETACLPDESTIIEIRDSRLSPQYDRSVELLHIFHGLRAYKGVELPDSIMSYESPIESVLGMAGHVHVQVQTAYQACCYVHYR